MDYDTSTSNLENKGLQLYKKRKSRKRGKKVKETENESSDSNVFENDVPDSEDVISLTVDCKLDEDPDVSTNENDTTPSSRMGSGVIVPQNPIDYETPKIQENDNGNIVENGVLGIRNLISDNNIRIFTDGVGVSCVGRDPNFNVAHKKEGEVYEYTSEDIKTIYPTTPIREVEHELYNTKPLDKMASTYSLEKFAQNLLIIFNHETFVTSAQRKGTHLDVIELKNTFEPLDFIVMPYSNRTKAQVMHILNCLSIQDFSDYGCIGIVVLTHGSDNGKLFASDDNEYTELDIINCLKTNKNPSMVTKPRFVIIQACRGTNALVGTPAFRRATIRTDLNYETEPYTLPVESDMLIFHSSYPGNSAHRDELNGTWLIQTLCKKIKELNPRHNFESILREVRREIAIDKEHIVRNHIGSSDINKQMPVVTTTLIRRLYLRKYGEEEEGAAANMTETNNHVTVDASSLAPTTDKCPCGLKYYSYIKTCLRHYVKDYPQDNYAQTLLALTDTFKNEELFDSTKEKCAEAISLHLDQNVRDSEYYKYLHIYKK